MHNIKYFPRLPVQHNSSLWCHRMWWRECQTCEMSPLSDMTSRQIWGLLTVLALEHGSEIWGTNTLEISTNISTHLTLTHLVVKAHKYPTMIPIRVPPPATTPKLAIPRPTSLPVKYCCHGMLNYFYGTWDVVKTNLTEGLKHVVEDYSHSVIEKRLTKHDNVQHLINLDLVKPWAGKYFSETEM